MNKTRITFVYQIMFIFSCMIAFRLYHIISTVLCTFVQLGFCQDVQITLGSISHPALTKSLVCISDFQGNVAFEQFLTSDQIEDGTTFSASVPDANHYCLSIINEYQIDSINSGSPFILARTFYNLDKDIHIRRFEHPVIGSFYPEKLVLLDLQNISNISFWQHASRSTYSNWKQKSNSVWATPNVWPYEDLFVVMKSKTEPEYKYIYIPHDELPDLITPIRVSDAINLDWKFLKTDLQHSIVKFPINSKYRGSIYAINSHTGNKCVFLDEKILSEAPKEAFDLFIPAQPLQDLKANMSWYDTYEFTYRIVHGKELNFPHFDKSNFEPETYVIDSTRIQTTMNPFPEFFKIIFTSTNQNEGIQIGRRLNQSIRSRWIIIGKNPTTIDFTLPKISPVSQGAFTTMEGWYIEKFENVKVLEKDKDIDWMNFFSDYNLLLVSYRDPFN